MTIVQGTNIRKKHEYKLLDEDDDVRISFFFHSTNGSVYVVYFSINEYDDYVEEYPELFNKGYAFGFFQYTKAIKNCYDELIFPTIEAIILDFIKLKGNDVVLLFHCDYSDGKQKCRDRLFSKWFKKSLNKHRFKRDRYEAKIEGTDIVHFMGYITPIENPNINAIQLQFDACSFNLMQDKMQNNDL